MPVSIKSRLGRYAILSRIGAGGMGEVYRARDTKLGRDVAIKVLPEAFVRDPGRMARFEREAKFLAALNHPNIAAIYGVEDAGSTDALVMELAEGPTLADRIASGPIPLAEALPIARQIADALEYAHEHGLVHRDLKPANIKVSLDGCVKILDFGLARAVEGEADATGLANSSTITQMGTEAGVLLGTVAYMSPEQVKGKQVDRRADIWAFGCVLYKMLTGKKAFAAETVTETLAAVLKNEPDWSQLASDTPVRIRVLLHRCLQKDPKQRLRDIGDARISLDEVLSGTTEDARALALTAPLWRRALPWALLGVTALALAIAVLALLHLRQQPSAPADPVRFQIALPERTRVATDLELSPDGQHLVIGVKKQDGPPQLWIRDLDSLEWRLLPGTEGALSAIWSPDSRSVAFASGGRLERVDISGGGPQTICAIDALVGDTWTLGGVWNTDGVIVFTSNQGLMKVSAAGGEPSILIKMHRSVGENQIGSPSFLPDGRHFLYSRFRGSRDSVATYVGSLDVQDEQQASKPLIAGAMAFYRPSVGPESILLYNPDRRTLMVQPFDASRWELKGNPSLVLEGATNFQAAAKVLAYMGDDAAQQLTLFDRQGKVLGTLREPGLYQVAPRISPDGRTVAVPLTDSSTGRTDLWLYDLEGGRRSRFTFDGKANQYPVWSPDGSRIAFYSADRPGPPWVYQKPVNGVGLAEAFEAPAVNRSRPMDWSPDGRYLIEQVRGEKVSIWVLPLSRGQADGERKLLPLLSGDFNAVRARLSPDGRWIAYDSDETGRYEIFVRTFPNPGGKWQVSSNGGARPVWSRDGKELYFVALDGNMMATNVKSRPDGSFVAGAARPLFNPHTWGLFSFDVTKDGRFLIPVTQQGAAPITVVVNWKAQKSK